jgi:hypothetical protein
MAVTETVPWLDGQIPAGPADPAGPWSLDKEEFIIGRRPPADLVLSHALVSRRHARIVQRDWASWIEDLGSRNGTFVNGRPVGATPARLEDGDMIVIAGAVSLTYHDPSATRAGPRLGKLAGVWIDEERGEVWVDAVQVEPPLSSAQLALLRLLYARLDQPVSHAEIIAAVWPDVDPAGVSKQALDGLIKRLRKRLRDASPEHDYIQVVRGYGRKLVDAL